MSERAQLERLAARLYGHRTAVKGSVSASSETLPLPLVERCGAAQAKPGALMDEEEAMTTEEWKLKIASLVLELQRKGATHVSISVVDERGKLYTLIDGEGTKSNIFDKPQS